jgi:acetolactate synthase-1/2/3 large subunit
VAQAEKPGSTHLELPEDVMATELSTVGGETWAPLAVHAPVRPEPSARDMELAADIIRGGTKVVALAGNGAVRGDASGALREFCRATGIAVAETFMGKGLVSADSGEALGATGLQAGDYQMAGFDDADVVVTIGYDLVEQSPQQWNPRRDKTIVCIDTLPAEIDGYYTPAVELVGDIRHVLLALAEECRDAVRPGGSTRLREATSGLLHRSASDDSFPMRPPRLLADIRACLGRRDILVSDVGLHKLWIGRMYPAYEPNTTLIANGLAGMGFAVPAAIAAKLVRPSALVVAVSGDGGFMMNMQELETAKRLKTAFVNVIWENGQFGSIEWKQRRRFGRSFGIDFSNPDFVALAAAFGLPGWRIDRADQFLPRLAHALTLDVPSVIVVPIDYSPDVAFTPGLGDETVAT